MGHSATVLNVVCVTADKKDTSLEDAFDKKVAALRAQILKEKRGEAKRAGTNLSISDLTLSTGLAAVVVNGKVEERLHRELCALVNVDVQTD